MLTGRNERRLWRLLAESDAELTRFEVRFEAQMNFLPSFDYPWILLTILAG